MWSAVSCDSHNFCEAKKFICLATKRFVTILTYLIDKIIQSSKKGMAVSFLRTLELKFHHVCLCPLVMETNTNKMKYLLVFVGASLTASATCTAGILFFFLNIYFFPSKFQVIVRLLMTWHHHHK